MSWLPTLAADAVEQRSKMPTGAPTNVWPHGSNLRGVTRGINTKRPKLISKINDIR